MVFWPKKTDLAIEGCRISQKKRDSRLYYYPSLRSVTNDGYFVAGFFSVVSPVGLAAAGAGALTTDMELAFIFPSFSV
jgi:cytochrome c biogenesis protein CcdA